MRTIHANNHKANNQFLSSKSRSSRHSHLSTVTIRRKQSRALCSKVHFSSAPLVGERRPTPIKTRLSAANWANLPGIARGRDEPGPGEGTGGEALGTERRSPLFPSGLAARGRRRTRRWRSCLIATEFVARQMPRTGACSAVLLRTSRDKLGGDGSREIVN